MLVKCVYRFTPYGELIWDMYNTETGRVMRLPADIISLKLPSEWCVRNYREATEQPTPRYAEWYMMHDHETFMCIEYNCLGFLAIDWVGNVKEVFHVYNKQVFAYSVELENLIGRHFTHIGWRKTTVLQYSHKPYIWEFLVDDDGNVFTTNGVFHLENFKDLDKGEAIKEYSGYVQCAKAGNFGVVYRNGLPLQVIANADKLIIEERS